MSKTPALLLAALLCAVISGCQTGFSREYYVFNGYEIGGAG